jgi:hypothetical protein
MGSSTDATSCEGHRNGSRCFMESPWRGTKGAEPCAVKAASTVLNGEDEETGHQVLRLVLTQRKRSGFSPHWVCLSLSVTDFHQTSDFCECFPTAYLQRRYRSGVQNFSDVPGKPAEKICN